MRVNHEYVRSVRHDSWRSAGRGQEDHQDHKAQRQSGLPPLELTLPEWNEAVEKQAAAIFGGEKVKQLSQLFDAPQYAQQFIELARKAGPCRDLRIRAKAVLTDAEGKPVINPKTKAPVVGWNDWHPSTAKVA